MLTEIGQILSMLLHEKPGVVVPQYVGTTSQSLKGRFRSHSYKIRNNSKRKYKNFLYDHFIIIPLNM